MHLGRRSNQYELGLWFPFKLDIRYTNNCLPTEAVAMLEAILFWNFTLHELNLVIVTSRRLPILPTLVNFCQMRRLKVRTQEKDYVMA